MKGEGMGEHEETEKEWAAYLARVRLGVWADVWCLGLAGAVCFILKVWG
jgi:hypothetical protein